MNGDGVGSVYVCIAVDVAGVIGQAGRADDADAAAPRRIAVTSPDIVATSTAQPRHRGIPAAVPQALVISAHAGDFLRISAVSGSYNFESAALLADVQAQTKSDIADVVGAFELAAFEQTPVTPSSDPLVVDDDGDKAEFWFWQATIVGAGTQQCHAVLALYDRDDQGRPSFAGLYRWDLALTVKLKQPSERQTQGGA